MWIPISCPTIASKLSEWLDIFLWMSEPFGLARTIKNTMTQKIDLASWIGWCEIALSWKRSYPANCGKNTISRSASVLHGMIRDGTVELFHMVKWEIFNRWKERTGKGIRNESRRALSQGVNWVYSMKNYTLKVTPHWLSVHRKTNTQTIAMVKVLTGFSVPTPPMIMAFSKSE